MGLSSTGLHHAPSLISAYVQDYKSSTESADSSLDEFIQRVLDDKDLELSPPPALPKPTSIPSDYYASDADSDYGDFTQDVQYPSPDSPSPPPRHRK
jgi:hypothetical protein